MLRGAGNSDQNSKLAIHYLRLASKRSAEACLALGKLYLKGARVPQDLPKAYTYLRTATLFKCICGSYADEYHSNRVSNPHVCHTTEAKKLLNSLEPDGVYAKQFKRKSKSWLKSVK